MSSLTFPRRPRYCAQRQTSSMLRQSSEQEREEIRRSRVWGWTIEAGGRARCGGVEGGGRELRASSVESPSRRTSQNNSKRGSRPHNAMQGHGSTLPRSTNPTSCFLSPSNTSTIPPTPACGIGTDRTSTTYGCSPSPTEVAYNPPKSTAERVGSAPSLHHSFSSRRVSTHPLPLPLHPHHLHLHLPRAQHEFHPSFSERMVLLKPEMGRDVNGVGAGQEERVEDGGDQREGRGTEGFGAGEDDLTRRNEWKAQLRGTRGGGRKGSGRTR